jgi:hypothetical protein
MKTHLIDRKFIKELPDVIFSNASSKLRPASVNPDMIHPISRQLPNNNLMFFLLSILSCLARAPRNRRRGT